MYGPEIIVRSLSRARIADQHGNTWQYHPQSDRHSKIACWAILFDLLVRCPLLRRHVEAGTVGFGINHTMTDFSSDRQKDLDLVISIPRAEQGKANRITFADLAEQFEVALSSEERTVLRGLPELRRLP